jgi:L-alanine-DL-glutamate epimerase-like enolase superfamily enzyme
MSAYSRRQFLTALGAVSTAQLLSRYHVLAASEIKRHKIRDVKVMMLQGARTYTLVRIETDSGHYGIGEGYGSPAVGVKEQILSLKDWLVGKDPLEIEALYTFLGEGTRNLSGTRTDGSAHTLIRAASGIEIALWDLAGKILEVPVATLLGGAYRDRVRVYNHGGPSKWLDKASCREWAQSRKADPGGWTGVKFGLTHTNANQDQARDRSNRLLTSRELREVRQGFENCREALGWDEDIMVHCHWEYDLRTAIQLAEAVEPIKPLWLEDPLPVDYADSWNRLVASTSVPICMGENLARRHGFKDFIINHAADIINPDVRNTGGLLETKKIADLADLFYLPMTNHNTGSVICTMATVQLAAAIRDYLMLETVVGKRDWMDDVIQHEEPIVQDGHIKLPGKPGLGIELNPDVVKAHLAPGETYWV